MGAVDTLKEVVGLIQKVDNIDLYRKVMSLQEQVYELFEENRLLKERLTMRETLQFKSNAYWRGDEGPFCSSCWDGEQKLVRLHIQRSYHPRCPTCGGVAPDPESGPTFA